MKTVSRFRACRPPGWGVGLSAIAATLLLFAGASDALGQTLNGVSCADVEANGVAANDPSERGFTNPVFGSPIGLPARSGFDYLGAYVWVTNDGLSDCAAELNDLYLCLSVAGRWGDADGDGVRDAQGGLCGTAINPGADGPLGELPLSRNEALTFFIDRNCDGTPDLQLEVAGMVGGSPTLVVTADDYTGFIGTDFGGEGVTFEYSDKDNSAYTTCPAEVTTKVLIRVANWDQFFDSPGLSPAIFSYDVNGGNRVDGPPEDNVRGEVDIVAPDLSITKGPNLALCEDEQDNVTITVTNTGNVAVSNIVVTDELPVGWISCGVVSGGVTVEQVGTTLTFSSFDLAPCEKKDIVLCLQAGAECTGGQNTASAEGVHLADCLDGGGRGVGPVSASSLLECLPEPCIEIRCDVTPAEVCAGDEYTVEVWGLNCSTGPEDITLWIDGESQFFGNVAPGAEVHFDWTFTAPVECPAGTVTNHTTRAVATNECNPDPGVEAECPVSVTCLPEPCIEIRCDVAPAEVCAGDEYTVDVWGKNCSAGSEDIVLWIDSESKLFEDVPPGEEVHFSWVFTAPAECPAGTVTNHLTKAVATNECNPDPGVDAECPVSVTCLPEPCVKIVCDVDKPNVCPGEEYTVTATATSCSDGPEDIVIYIDDHASEPFSNVAPGAEVSFKWTFTAPADCPAGTVTEHLTRAVATNVCNPDPGVEATCPVSVTCLPEPCVDIRCDVNPKEVCEGDEYTVDVWGKNCSAGPEDIVLWIDGESKFFEDVAAGVEVHFSWVFTAGACPASGTVDHLTKAVATNECNPSPGVEKTCPVSVTCLPEPCVEAFCEVLDTQLIPGESTIIRGSAKNCGNGPADITIFILGPDDLGQVYCQETFLDVAAGATVDHECDWDCTPQTSGIHNFRVRAVATNDCGEATDQSDGECAVNCEEPGLCWMTSGGNHSGQDSKGQKLWTWGGNVGPPPHGSWQHTERDGEGTILFNFHSHDVEVFSCYHDGGDGPCHPNAEDNVILYGGTGEYNLGKGKKIYQAQWEARAEDHGEPGNTPNRDGGCGSPDFYYIKVWNSDTQEVIFEHGEYVEGGNIQIHPLKENQMRRIDDAAGRTDLRSNSDLGLGDEMQLGQLALYTPTPNPFNHTTRVAYAVKGGTSERVDIGIYNVAGQLVRKLVSGMESPGYHEVTWDARSEAGVQVSPGVYFLRAFVGAERIKGTRILYMR